MLSCRALASVLATATRQASPSSGVSDIVFGGSLSPWLLSRALFSSISKRSNASSAAAADAAEASSIDSAATSSVEEFRDMVRDFALKEIAPYAEYIDKNNSFPKDVNLWQKMGEFGLHGAFFSLIFFSSSHSPRKKKKKSQPRHLFFSHAQKKIVGKNTGITVPTSHGGLGLGYLEHVVAMEELSRASGSVALSYGAHSNLCVSQLARNATEDQKKKFLPKLLTGEHVGALAMSEPDAGSDVVSMRTKATKVEGGWCLDGNKMWITNGTVADVVIVYAKTDPSAGAKGVTAFVIDRAATTAADPKQFKSAQKLDKLGMRGSDTCELVFEKCFVPDDGVLGAAGGGARVLFSGLDYERLVLSGGPLGLARAALEDVAVPYAAQRKQFGMRIGDFQLVAAKLADGWTRTQAARALVYSAAAKADAKKEKKGDAAPASPSPPSPLSVSGGWSSRGERAKECAAAILFSAETATQVALDALQVLGGNGYINEYPTGEPRFPSFFFVVEREGVCGVGVWGEGDRKRRGRKKTNNVFETF